MISRFRIPSWAVIVAIYLFIFMSSPAIAGLIASTPSQAGVASAARGEEIGKIQRALENKIVAEKLRAYGLSSGEVKEKLLSMTDDQVHLLAKASDRLLEGADDGLGILFAILIIILLVIVILKLMHKDVVIK